MEHMIITWFALIFICTASEPDVYDGVLFYLFFFFTGTACGYQVNSYLQQKYKISEEAEEDLHININMNINFNKHEILSHDNMLGPFWVPSYFFTTQKLTFKNLSAM